MALTRRELVAGAGQAGGYGAAYILMQSLGLLPTPQAIAQKTLTLPPVRDTPVVILGAGIAGLVAAYELARSGYRCTILEGRNRSGGRNWTIRRGGKVTFTDRTEQVCGFEAGQYLNAGAARISSIHTAILGYCKELGVPLEVEVNMSRSALMQSDRLNGGVPVEGRQVLNDSRGHVAELLSKAINRGALDQELTADDKARMIVFLSAYGDLNEAGLFKGTERSGFKSYPDADASPPVIRDPLSLHSLLDADLWAFLLEDDEIGKQAAMFQPVDGMDRIAAAFEAKLAGAIRFGAEVTQIRQSATSVTVAYKDVNTGSASSVIADYCICTIPPLILKTLDADFSPDVKDLFATSTHDSAYKIGWESRRFWEQDYNIYGGISYLRQDVDTVWYPSGQMFSLNGVIVGGYSLENGTAFGQLPDTQAKLAASSRAIETLHPGRAKELKNPVYVNWGRIPYSLGSWATGLGGRGYERVILPDRRVFFAGDYTSELVGWQEGAVLSARRAVSQIGRQPR